MTSKIGLKKNQKIESGAKEVSSKRILSPEV
jgi:hypothetical protein